ncbi:MAG: hypothetical protein DRP68_07450, partial [Candidatus Omnitrophota bacterium]
LRRLVHHYYINHREEFEKYLKLIVLTIDGVSDNGGHIRRLEDDLINHPEWKNYPLATGDISVFPSIFTDNDAKIELLTKRRITGKSALECIRENLKAIMNDERFRYSLPPDWNFFCANMLAMARRIDYEWIEKKVTSLDRASWQNLFYVMARYLIGEVTKESNKPNPEKSYSHIYEMTGTLQGYALPCSLDISPLAAILQAVTLKIGNEAINIGRIKNKAYYTLVKAKKIEDRYFLETTPLKEESRYLITSEEKEIKLSGEKITIRLNDSSEIVIKIRGEEIILTEDKNEEGKTILKRANEEIVLPTNASWQDIKIKGLKVSFKSRLVEGQTHITDANEYHPSSVYKAIFKELVIKEEKGRKERTYTSRSPQKYSSAHPKVIEAIGKIKQAIMFGDCSLITSYLPILMTEGIPQALKERKGQIPLIFIFKIMQDIESKGLNIIEQIELIERSVREATTLKDFKMEDITDYVVLLDPRIIPYEKRREFGKKQEKLRKDLENPEIQEKIAKGEKKYSKIAPEEPQYIENKELEITREKIEKYFAKKGIRIKWAQPQDIRILEGKYAYDEERMIDIIESIIQEYTQLAEIEAKLNQILEESLYDIKAPPSVTLKNYRLSLILPQDIPSSQQPLFEKLLKEKIAQGKLKIQLKDEEGKVFEVKEEDIEVHFGSIKLEILLKEKTYTQLTLTYTTPQKTISKTLPIERKPPSFTAEEDFEENLKEFSYLYGVSEEDVLKLPSLREETKVTGRSIKEIITGIVSELKEPSKTYYQRLDDWKNLEIEFLWMGGAGIRTTDFLRRLVHHYYINHREEFEKYLKLIVLTIDGVSDNGGHIRRL